jgi:hypothetical protein
MVLKADVAEFWSFQQPRTGAPGHPSSMPLVEAAFDARRARNETAASLAEESRCLANWVKSEYPADPPVTEKTIQNCLREKYRQHQLAQN